MDTENMGYEGIFNFHFWERYWKLFATCKFNASDFASLCELHLMPFLLFGLCVVDGIEEFFTDGQNIFYVLQNINSNQMISLISLPLSSRYLITSTSLKFYPFINKNIIYLFISDRFQPLIKVTELSL